MGFGITEDLAVEDLIQERYRGIRPAAGYPACPGSYREAGGVGFARCGGEGGDAADEQLCDVPAE
jgi:hypothetical protein